MASAVKGYDKLVRQIAAMPQLVHDAAHDTLEANANDLAAAIARAAPKKTGQMARGVKAEPATDGVRASAGLSFKVSAPLPSRWVEFSTQARGVGRYRDARGKTHNPRHAHHATRAEPFFWPTVRALRPIGHRKVSTAMNQAAKAVAAVS